MNVYALVYSGKPSAPAPATPAKRKLHINAPKAKRLKGEHKPTSNPAKTGARPKQIKDKRASANASTPPGELAGIEPGLMAGLDATGTCLSGLGAMSPMPPMTPQSENIKQERQEEGRAEAMNHNPTQAYRSLLPPRAPLPNFGMYYTVPLFPWH